MLQVSENTLNSILKNKFSTLVGTLCERIEDLEKEDLDKKVFVRLIKKNLKKDAWNTMREIKAQIQKFSEGTIIDVKLIKPNSTKE
jgi:hypothetical protein